jgi:hypothetical protein
MKTNRTCILAVEKIPGKPNGRRYTANCELSTLSSRISLVPGAPTHQQRHATTLVREAGDNMLHFISEGVGSSFGIQGIKAVAVNGNSVEIEIEPHVNWVTVERVLKEQMEESFDFRWVEINTLALAA